MGQKILLDLNDEEMERINHLKGVFSEKTYSKTIKKLIKFGIIK